MIKKLKTFVIPNGWMYAGDLRTFAKKDMVADIKATYGIDVEDHDRLITLWTVDPDDGANSNLEAHGASWTNGKRFSYYAPERLFEGKKEGDCVTFTGDFGTCEVQLAQLDYRYRRFGNFESVLKAQTYNPPFGN